jgi:S-adenosylmethionine/arginine decarboxylase-like enzyme
MAAVAQQVSGQYRKLNSIIISNCCTLIAPQTAFQGFVQQLGAKICIVRVLESEEVYRIGL